MSNIVKEVTDATFYELVLKSSEPVLIDFWAEWCGPCRALAPYYEEAAERLTGKATFCKYNVDQNPSYMKKLYGINAIPTVILFRGGREPARAVGGAEVAKLINALAAELGV